MSWKACSVLSVVMAGLAAWHAPAQELAPGAELPRLENSLGMLFRQVPAGEILVGEPGMPRRRAIYQNGNSAAGLQVSIGKPYWIGVHEVRIRDYRAFCQATRRAEPKGERYDVKRFRWLRDFRPLAHDPLTDRYLALPITCVTYDDAMAFCQWLSKKEKRTYRLPTEVEWEYAARAGSDKPFQESDAFDVRKINGMLGAGELLPANPQELFFDAEGNGQKRPAERKSALGRTRGDADLLKRHPPNAWGLFHMLGNAQEFVVMTHEPPDDDLPLPCYTVLPGKVNRMLRGGSWLHDQRDCTVFRANYNCPPYSNITMGFRVVLESR